MGNISRVAGIVAMLSVLGAIAMSGVSSLFGFSGGLLLAGLLLAIVAMISWFFGRKMDGQSKAAKTGIVTGLCAFISGFAFSLYATPVSMDSSDPVGGPVDMAAPE
ncbi:hypothetical protein ACFOWX_11925 [Sphingorhabdus arenilitoris]|uniref:DUF4190 domain-containing protein n=1 Tax=Sphingorhabdus arenilitoris TaxID=1490041 RepID=A0ABV8RIU8_9SPHN